MTPIALIGFGAAMCSASGVLNIGLEGKMLNAAFIGVAASYYSGSALTGFIAGVSAGVLTAILFGVLSFNLGADEVLAGLAINIFAIAFTRYLLETLFVSNKYLEMYFGRLIFNNFLQSVSSQDTRRVIRRKSLCQSGGRK